MEKTILTIYPDTSEGTIPRNLFGHFLEYMHDCIDPGLWAELLLSRGFEEAEEEQGKNAAVWAEFGENINGSFDQKCRYAEGQSLRLENMGGEGGIQQHNLKLRKRTNYNGYVWAYSDEATCFEVRILSDKKECFYRRQFVSQPEDWTQFSYSFYNADLQKNATIQFVTKSAGVLWLDQSSLCPEDNCSGVWPDVMEYIKDLQPGIMRFPGGCAADCYSWMDGIGPRDKRPSRINKHWGGIEQNHFGTDEFLAFCEELGCEPLICINFGSSTAENAANWVEYCNGSLDTEFGQLRAKNGHPSPYGVKYWEIGNEVFGEWEIGHCSAEEYAEKYLEFARKMKRKDPTIQLLACGGDGGNSDQTWNRTVLKHIRGSLDALTLHLYAPMVNSKLFADQEMYWAVVAASMQDEEVLRCTLETMKQLDCKVPLAITEWNCNYGEEDDTQREQTLEAAIANACVFNLFLRSCNHLCMANVSDLINGWGGGIIRSERGDAFGTATYYLLKMYVEMDPRIVVKHEMKCDTYETMALGNLKAQKMVPYVDAVCCKNSDGEMIAFLVNRHYQESILLEIPGWEIEWGYQLWAKHVLVKNDSEEPDLIKAEKYIYQRRSTELLPHGIYALKLKALSCK